MKRKILSLGKELNRKDQQVIKGGYMVDEGECIQECAYSSDCPGGLSCRATACMQFGERGTRCVNNG